MHNDDYYDDQYLGLSPVIEMDFDGPKDKDSYERAAELGLNPELIDLNHLEKYEEAIEMGIGTFYLECGLVDFNHLEDFDEMNISLLSKDEEE